MEDRCLTWWIDTGTRRVLFDTGQGMVLLPLRGEHGTQVRLSASRCVVRAVLRRVCDA